MAGALALLALAAVPAHAQDDPAAAARRVLDSGDYQTELPTDLPEVEPPPAPAPMEPPGEPIDLGAIADALLWLIVVAGIGLLVYSLATHPGIRRRLRRWRTPEDQAGRGGTGTGPAAGDGARDVDRADALAREGRLEEAVHLLLLRAIEELRAQRDPSLPESLTSREVLRRLSLPDTGRAALRHLVEAVERSWFGGRPVRPDDYAACRRSFDALARLEAA